jgi:N-acetylneuraminate synthase
MVAKEGKHTFISTGMSTLEEIAIAVNIFREANCSFELMHCNSTYPMKNEDANLNVIHSLRTRFNCDVGYSGHEQGRIVSVVAVALGATSLERHITLDKTMYGSDQSASVTMDDFVRLIEDVRTTEFALGSSEKIVLDTEIPIREKLRKF